jgi:NAD(P)-dependent dehydrogenase (short-subunit alcohol dehydrogenase family)
MAIAILGATSAIGREIAKVLESEGHKLVLFARNPVGAMKKLDVLDFDESLFRLDLLSAGSLDGVVLCVGYLGDNLKAFSDPDEAARILDTNFTGSAHALDVAAGLMDHGFIVALSSVAGDRPRRKVFTYGRAKGLLNDHLARMRSRLAPAGIRVVTIKLGSVDTRMISHRRKHPFVVSAPDAASAIVSAALRSDGVVYLPGKWRLIMGVMKLVPSILYERL